jgi:hypothetical protein
MKELVNQLRSGQLKERMLSLRDELTAVETPAAGPHDLLRKQLLGVKDKLVATGRLAADPPAASKPARKRTKRP